MLRVSGRPDERIAIIATCQRGRVSRPQLLAAGLTRNMIEHRLRAGTLTPLHAGVYAAGHAAPVQLGAETALLLAAGPDALLSHRTAGALWELLRTHDIHITVPGRRAPRRSGGVLHRSESLLPHDTRIHRGLPVSSPARTLLDLAPAVSARELELLLDSALRAGILRLRQLDELLGRHRGRPGAALLRALSGRDRSLTFTRSEAEEMLLALVRQAGLPQPELNVRCAGYEVDALWRAQRLVVEVDGWRYHSSRRAFEADRAKGAALTAAGHSVLRVTVRQMRDERLTVVARLAQALAWASTPG